MFRYLDKDRRAAFFLLPSMSCRRATVFIYSTRLRKNYFGTPETQWAQVMDNR